MGERQHQSGPVHHHHLRKSDDSSALAKNGLACRGFGNRAEPTLSGMELLHRVIEVGGRKIRPPAMGEVQFGVGAFPEKEVAEPLFSAGADQQVYIAALASPVVDLAHRPREIFASDAI